MHGLAIYLIIVPPPSQNLSLISIVFKSNFLKLVLKPIQIEPAFWDGGSTWFPVVVCHLC